MDKKEELRRKRISISLKEYHKSNIKKIGVKVRRKGKNVWKELVIGEEEKCEHIVGFRWTDTENGRLNAYRNMIKDDDILFNYCPECGIKLEEDRDG